MFGTCSGLNFGGMKGWWGNDTLRKTSKAFKNQAPWSFWRSQHHVRTSWWAPSHLVMTKRATPRSSLVVLGTPVRLWEWCQHPPPSSPSCDEIRATGFEEVQILYFSDFSILFMVSTIDGFSSPYWDKLIPATCRCFPCRSAAQIFKAVLKAPLKFPKWLGVHEKDRGRHVGISTNDWWYRKWEDWPTANLNIRS